MYITQEQKQKFIFKPNKSCNNNCGCSRSLNIKSDAFMMHESYWKSGLCPQCYMEQNKDSKLFNYKKPEWARYRDKKCKGSTN